MSTYKAKTKNPITGEFENALWIDDHFGSHQYGVRFDNDDGTFQVYNPETIKLELAEENIVYYPSFTSYCLAKTGITNAVGRTMDNQFREETTQLAKLLTIITLQGNRVWTSEQIINLINELQDIKAPQ